METKAFVTHASHIQSLIALVLSTESRIISNNDAYFTDNANFFCKSFLITTCTYLESYLKEIASAIISEVEERLNQNAVAYNIVRWSIDKNSFKNFKYEVFKLGISEADIDDNISGNVDRTLTLFRKLGINLESEPKFYDKKDVIAPIINKRNNIVHYNDDASDLSLGDVRFMLTQVLDYMSIIDACITRNISPSLTELFFVESDTSSANSA